jgi:hypothetical protein
METQCVFCTEESEFLNNIQVYFILQIIKWFPDDKFLRYDVL